MPCGRGCWRFDRQLPSTATVAPPGQSDRLEVGMGVLAGFPQICPRPDHEEGRTKAMLRQALEHGWRPNRIRTSSNVSAHRRAPIVVLLTAERRHPTRASRSSSERAFGSGARAHRPGVQRVGRSLGRAASRADPRAPGVRSLDAARDLYGHGRIRPYLGCLRERPQGLSWACSQLGDGGSASDHHRRV